MRNLLNPNVETVILGGLGSDEKCVTKAAKSLETVLEQKVIGVTNHDARANIMGFVALIDGRNVIPYSGGATTTYTAIDRYSARPASVNFVAPPDTLSRYGALRGFVKSAVARTASIPPDDDEGALSQISRFIREVGGHPEDYFRLIHESRRFEQLAAAVSLRSLGIDKVGLVVPRDDEMFSSYELPSDHNPGDVVDGVRYIVVDGGHTRFSSDSAGMLREAETSPFAVVNEHVLGVDIPERLWAAPTLGKTLAASTHGLIDHIIRQRDRLLAA
ncbi:MAG: hypothetical protein WAW60_01720 [Candidatus Saccharimonadales bacterium]